MKKNYKYMFLLPMMLIFSSCSDFLDLRPISNSSVAGFYQTQNDFTNAIVGAYSSLRSSGTYNFDMAIFGDLRSDNTEMGSTASDRFHYNDLSLFQINSDNKIPSQIWNSHYLGISRTNEILGRINGLSDAPQSFKDGIEGEARFLRALFFFNLVRVFGDVPLIPEPLKTIDEAYEIGRTPQVEVYALIIDDLTSASSKLPVKATQQGRATKGASQALLGKVYLTVGEYDKARTAFQSVIQSGEYSLEDEFEDLWKVENKNNSEIIFAVQFVRASSGGTGSRYFEYFTPYLYPYIGYYTTNGGYSVPTENLVESFETGDIRKSASLQESYIDPEGNLVTGLQGRFQTKYTHLPVQGQGSNDNWPILRYADVYLSYAEALNEISFVPNGEAFEYVNSIRRRAGLADVSAGNTDSNMSVDSQAEFRDLILRERRSEFAFEGHRWFDLVRTGKVIEAIKQSKGIDINENYMVLPIPQEQIDINPEKIKQNPGY